jgi:phage-related protein
MVCMTNPDRPFVWVGSTQSDLLAMPQQVRRDIGQALYAMQQGVTDPAARPVRTYRRELILEVVQRYRRVSHSAVYQPLESAVWVLRASPREADAATPEPDRS